jgi:hypothetical protein
VKSFWLANNSIAARNLGHLHFTLNMTSFVMVSLIHFHVYFVSNVRVEMAGPRRSVGHTVLVGGGLLLRRLEYQF